MDPAKASVPKYKIQFQDMWEKHRNRTQGSKEGLNLRLDQFGQVMVLLGALFSLLTQDGVRIGRVLQARNPGF